MFNRKQKELEKIQKLEQRILQLEFSVKCLTEISTSQDKKIEVLKFKQNCDCDYKIDEIFVFNISCNEKKLAYLQNDCIKNFKLIGDWAQKGKVLLHTTNKNTEYEIVEYYLFDTTQECLVKISRAEVDKIWGESKGKNK